MRCALVGTPELGIPSSMDNEDVWAGTRTIKTRFLRVFFRLQTTHMTRDTCC